MPGKQFLHSAGDWKIALTPAIAVTGMIAVAAMIASDIIHEIPERPLTSTELARDSPVTIATWRSVYARLQRRLEPWQPRPPELGAVWSTRSGEICGLVDAWHTGLDQMTRFYTVRGEPYFREDNLYLYLKTWPICLDHPWILLHHGTLTEGACASATARKLSPKLCQITVPSVPGA